MLKLMKYELIKNKTSKLMLGGFLLLAELIFIFGLITNGNNAASLGIISLSVVSFVGFFVVALEAIVTYYRDLRKKRGLLLFMTPHSEYEILWSKILVSILTIFVWTILIAVLAFIDGALFASAYSVADKFFATAREMLQSLFSLNISWSTFVFVLLDLVFSWCAMLTSAFLAITLSMTTLTRVKAKGIVSFVLFIVLNYIYSRATDLVLRIFHVSDYTIRYSMQVTRHAEALVTSPTMLSNVITFCITVAFVLLFFYLTGTLLKKKLSL